MKSNKSFSIRARATSFKYAFEGIENFFRSEPNALLHLLGTVLVLGFAFAIHVAPWEMSALILAIGFVWVDELFNTAIEKIMDCISTEKHPKIKLIKDLSAGAVLIAAIAAFITGCIIFIPKL